MTESSGVMTLSSCGLRGQVDFGRFTMAEAAQITGLGAEAIRSWKRRSLLPGQGSYSRLESPAVADLMVRRALVTHGISPGASIPLAQQYGRSVLHFSLLDTPGSCIVRGTVEQVNRFAEVFNQSAELAATISGIHLAAVSSILVSEDEGPLKPLKSDAIPLEDGVRSGFFVNLRGMGQHLGAAANQAVVSIELEREPVSGEAARVIVRRFPD